jgi:multicomponent Na+:H+ antiporter subunit G
VIGAGGVALALLGALVVLVAAAGLVRLPDALSRQHAATKAGTLGVALVALGAGLWAGEWAWTWRLAAIGGLLLLTLPIASHVLARAALREQGPGGAGRPGAARHRPPDRP